MLHQLSQSAIALHGTNTSRIIDHIVTNLTVTYGETHINPKQDEWFFNNAGGAMGEQPPACHISTCSFSFI
jgi:C-8 sterol isomerase